MSFSLSNHVQAGFFGAEQKCAHGYRHRCDRAKKGTAQFPEEIPFMLCLWRLIEIVGSFQAPVVYVLVLEGAPCLG